MRRARAFLLCCTLLAAIGASMSHAAETGASTPAEMVKAYDSLADTILGAKRTEANLIQTILAATYRHAEVTMARVKEKAQAGQDAKAEVEKLAALVSQLGNEGDAAVAGVRKRLLEGGHHHNAAGEQQGVFDEGFVVVTRAAKKVFLDAATAIGKLGAKTDLPALDAEWGKVSKQFTALHK